MALFSPNAVLRYLVKRLEHRGHEAIARFYQRVFDAMGGGIEMKLDDAVRIASNHAVAVHSTRTINDSEVNRTKTVVAMVFDAAGRILSMDVHCRPVA